MGQDIGTNADDANREVLLEECDGKPIKRLLGRTSSHHRLLEERGNPHADVLGRPHNGVYSEHGRINYDAISSVPNSFRQGTDALKVPGILLGAVLGFIAGETVIAW